MESSRTRMIVCSVLCFFARAEAEELKDPSIQSVDLSAHGWVDYRYCTGDCAALGDPYRYNLAAISDVEDAALAVISGMGFSYQDSTKSPAFKECDLETSKAGFARFWTDYITLNDAIVAKMGTTWSDLGLSRDPSVVIQFRITGCHFQINDAFSTVGEHPEFSHVQMDPRFFRPYDSEIALIMKVDMRERALKSSFYPITVSVSPKSILDNIAKRMSGAVYNIPTTEIQCLSDGKIVY